MNSLDIIIQVFVFLAAALLSMLAARRVEARLSVRRRLWQDAPPPRRRAPGVIKDKVSNSILSWVQQSSSLSVDKGRETLTRDLAYAGFEQLAAPIWYVIVRFGLAIGLPFAFIIAQKLATKPVSGPTLILFSLALCGLGLIAPQMIIRRRAAARRDQLDREFPDALDLMVVCVESGLGLESAFVRVGAETSRSHPLIADEFDRIAQQLRAGRSRPDALRTFAERSQSIALKSFTTLLIQTDALGTSIGQSLRTYSAEMRETRLMHAEEKAMRIPVLLTVPLVVCILPVIVTPLLLPALIDAFRHLSPVMQHRQEAP